MKDFLLSYILFNLCVYGASVGIVYNDISDGTYKCRSDVSDYWGYVAVGLAGFMLENSTALRDEINDYCESLPPGTK